MIKQKLELFIKSLYQALRSTINYYSSLFYFPKEIVQWNIEHNYFQKITSRNFYSTLFIKYSTRYTFEMIDYWNLNFLRKM